MRKLIVIFAICCLLTSCSYFKKEVKRVDAAGNLYVDGVNLLQAKKYSKAIEKFSAIRENHPFDPLAIVAAVKLGDAHFMKKDYVLAASAYEDFFKSHPEDENVPYVLLKLGECYEKLSPSLDRDQSYTVKSIERLTYLRNRYPSDQYSSQAEPILKRMVEKLAARELYVGEFYYRSHEYNAAILRLENLLVKYPDSKGIDKALFYLAMSYRELGNQDKSDEYTGRLRIEYPKSLYSRSTVRTRKALTPVKEQTKISTPISPLPAMDPVKTNETETSLYEEKKERVINLSPPPAAKAPIQPAGTETQTGSDKSGDGNTPPAQAKEETSGNNSAGRQKTGISVTDVTPENTAPVQAGIKEKKTVPVNNDTPTKTAKTDKQESSAKAGVKENATTPDKSKEKKGLSFFDKKKPVDIVSDTMEGFDKDKTVIFKGSVIAKQEDLTIFGDVMEAYMNEETNEIDKAIVKGNVKIVKQNRTATCREALFENGKGEITLTGNVIVYQDQDKLTGDVIIYYINEDKVVVKADKDKRARITVKPKEKR